MSYTVAPLARSGHAAHANRCLTALPASQVELDPSKLAIAYYCLGTLDLLGLLQTKTSERDRDAWRGWLWEQQTHGAHGTGFRPSHFMTVALKDEYTDASAPHIIMTYTALLGLAILRDDFKRLDREGLRRFVRACQLPDGSFGTTPTRTDADLRTTYCAFAICSMLDDWSAVDVPAATGYIARCRSFEGGYGQAPAGEALGGTTYTAIAALHLAARSGLHIGPQDSQLHVAPQDSQSHVGSREQGQTRERSPLSPRERAQTIRWLLANQTSGGGFSGRINKEADACYCFWCGAALQILGAGAFVDADALAAFFARCQFKYGGIAKAPDEHPDPYHTYLSLAAASMYPPTGAGETWAFEPFDCLLNARVETAQWARMHIPASST
ncbi:terpenoid cyclases/protein prenyltransferase alpha-alpha toroid [Schizophyllum amplum]|uniref:Terpenoid cyclases/protein prenyltransferase alpha-alpha toroid n=1 Tax=Schizophyllum amplum TaxID=97359 RepID=A0A550CBF6_9AGAR|nr:terpenoid cyclases/protein prenyltransferase alpha-alpha toroid [Auriculariopsis ampla]